MVVIIVSITIRKKTACTLCKHTVDHPLKLRLQRPPNSPSAVLQHDAGNLLTCPDLGGGSLGGGNLGLGLRRDGRGSCFLGFRGFETLLFEIRPSAKIILEDVFPGIFFLPHDEELAVVYIAQVFEVLDAEVVPFHKEDAGHEAVSYCFH